MRFTIILNTHNRAHFLPLVLWSWTRQTHRDFDVVVADDGSADGTRELLQKLAPELPFSLTHVWHPHEGHRRAEILNKAIHAAQSEALLFTDADCMPAADLLVEHARAFNGRRLLCGGYLRLSPEFTQGMTRARAVDGSYEAQLDAASRRRLLLQHWKNQFYVFLRVKGRPHNMGLNMALPRSAYREINGYDNNFRGWGKADGDLRERLRRIGVRPWSVWHSAVTFHLHHPPDATKPKKANQEYAERADIPTRAASGFAEVEPQIVFSTRQQAG
jgi:glycosyltransferase involved in cell wall biosynthesis